MSRVIIKSKIEQVVLRRGIRGTRTDPVNNLIYVRENVCPGLRLIGLDAPELRVAKERNECE